MRSAAPEIKPLVMHFVASGCVSSFRPYHAIGLKPDDDDEDEDEEDDEAFSELFLEVCNALRNLCARIRLKLELF